MPSARSGMLRKSLMASHAHIIESDRLLTLAQKPRPTNYEDFR
jgi:hypothetical protein